MSEIQELSHSKETRINSTDDCKPSLTTLSRIFKVLSERGSLGRTSLALYSKINYVRLLRYLDWLERKNLVKLAIKNGRIVVILSSGGQDIADTFSSFS